MLNFESLTTVARRLEAREISSVELCRAVLDCIAESNRAIGAYSDVLDELAEIDAEASDERRARGDAVSPLDGVPVAIKDLIDTTPAICKAGLGHLANHKPQRDADVVRLLRDAGAVVVGVVETDAGAFGTRTPQTINPLAPERIVGGSSGGSAAAVCAGLAFGALGTDTGGSIRIPAACCSVSGFKPTWGRISVRGVRVLAASYDHVGPIARNVADLQSLGLVLDPGVRADLNREFPSILTIGICEQYYRDADNYVETAMMHAIDLLQRDGHRVRAVDLPLPNEFMPFHVTNVTKEAANHQLEESPIAWKSYPPVARGQIELGLAVSDAAYQSALGKRTAARVSLDEALEQVDCLLLPTMPVDAPERDQDTIVVGGVALSILETTVRYTSLLNQTGHPVVSMPVHLMYDGRATSAQIVGARNSDGRLLKIAHILERSFAVSVEYAKLVARNRNLMQSVRRAIA